MPRLTKIEKPPRRDRFKEGVAMLCDLSLTSIEAVNAYERHTRRLTGPNRAFGLNMGMMLRIAKLDLLAKKQPKRSRR